MGNITACGFLHITISGSSFSFVHGTSSSETGAAREQYRVCKNRGCYIAIILGLLRSPGIFAGIEPAKMRVFEKLCFPKTRLDFRFNREGLKMRC